MGANRIPMNSTSGTAIDHDRADSTVLQTTQTGVPVLDIHVDA